MGMTCQILIELVFLSLSGTVLGLLLWLLRPLTRRLFSWKWHYYLWLAVLLRLALPVHVDMGWEILPARESGVSAVSELPEAGGRAFVDAQISGEQVSGEQASGEQSSIEQNNFLQKIWRKRKKLGRHRGTLQGLCQKARGALNGKPCGSGDF